MPRTRATTVEGKPQKRALLIVQGDLLEQVREYHRVAGIPGTLGDTMRELVVAALSSPQLASTAVQQARRRAYRHVRQAMQLRFSAFERTAQAEFERDLLSGHDDDELDRKYNRMLAVDEDGLRVGA